MEWLVKQKSGGKGFGEVYISEVCKNSSPAVSIRFTGEAIKKITKGSHIKIALKGTRIYFDEAESYEGWKLCSTRGSDNVFFKIKKVALPTTGVEGGNYNLEFDASLGYYYIDVRNKISTLNWRK